MKNSLTITIALCLSPCLSASATQEAPPLVETAEANTEQPASFAQASLKIDQRLSRSLDELTALREQLVAEKLPLNRKLNELQVQLSEVRSSYQSTTRMLDSRTLDLSNLRREIKQRKEQSTYLTGLLGEYSREFATRLHRCESQRYESVLEAARLLPESDAFSGEAADAAQLDLVKTSLYRLEEALKGTRFEGQALDEHGSLHAGTFAIVGPSAYFSTPDGEVVGIAQQLLNSLETTAVPFLDPVNAEAASSFVQSGNGVFPFDPTLGKAHKMAATKESILDEVKKGGLVMYPIFAMAALALFLATLKWLSMLLLRKPSKKKISALLDAVSRKDEELAVAKASAINGPLGRMLTEGARHLGEPRELVEEVMFEVMLITRLKLQAFLPFISICAASAPLLGLLGTVTGIIKTFKMITVFGSGDVKVLSDGISEALITTKYGLVVAIPSLLLHAFLSRKARGVIGNMETSAVKFMNQIVKSKSKRARVITPAAAETEATPDPGLVREQVSAILGEILAPITDEGRHHQELGAR